MTLPTTGPMKASAIRTELKATGRFDINAANYRGLAKKPSGLIKFSDFRGKSNGIPYDITLGGNAYFVGLSGSLSPTTFKGNAIRLVAVDGPDTSFVVAPMRIQISGNVPAGAISAVVMDGVTYPRTKHTYNNNIAEFTFGTSGAKGPWRRNTGPHTFLILE